MMFFKSNLRSAILNVYFSNCYKTSLSQTCTLNKLRTKISSIVHYSTDYSKLKPVDLSFIKFDGKASKTSPIFIYHGLFGSKNNWRSLGRMISDRSNRDTYVFDVRNHGESPHSSQFTYPIIANDIKHFMEKNRIPNAIMLGHSLGGRAFSKLSFMFPELVEKLVVVDVHPTNQIPANEYLSLKFCNILKQAIETIHNSSSKLTLSSARKLVDEHLKPQIPDNFLRQFFLSSLCERDNRIDWRFNFPVLAEFLTRRLNEITIDRSFNGECLLIYGGKSVYFDESHFESVREIFPKIQFQVVPDGNHYLHISHHEEFLEKLVPFLKA